MELAQHSHPGISLLVVDDDHVTLEVLTLMISKKFPTATIYSANSGRTAVELFKKHKHAIVITDIQMPGMDGIEMASEIKVLKADTKFIVLTAYGNTNYQEKFSEIGCHDFLSKPIEFPRLYAAIESCIAEVNEH